MINRYYVRYKTDGTIYMIGVGIGGTEITEAEYNALLAEILKKSELVDKLYSGEITIDDVPTEWQEEIQRRVNERIAADEETADEPVSGDEFLSMMEEVL